MNIGTLLFAIVVWSSGPQETKSLYAEVGCAFGRRWLEEFQKLPIIQIVIKLASLLSGVCVRAVAS